MSDGPLGLMPTRSAAAWGGGALAALAALFIAARPPEARSDEIRVSPPFAAFQGTVGKLKQQGRDLVVELREPQDGVTTVRLSGLPDAVAAIACNTCRVVSRVERSPRGPSQVITFLDGDRTIAAIGVNTLPDVCVLAGEGRSQARLRWDQDAKNQGAQNQGIKSGDAAVTLDASGAKQTLSAGDKADFTALNRDWTLHVGRAAVVESGDVVGAQQPDDVTLRTDWLLVAGE